MTGCEKKTATERLLAKREAAGACHAKNLRYHLLVTRYQKWVLRRYVERRSGDAVRGWVFSRELSLRTGVQQPESEADA